MVEIQYVGPPRSYTKGRARKIQGICLHYTAGREGRDAAEAGAAYDRRRTDGTSTHYFTDSQLPVLCTVRPKDRAHTARFHGNQIFIHIEICGTRQTRAQWLDATSKRTLEITAALVAYLLVEYKLQFRRLSVAQCRAAYYAKGDKPTGIVDHETVTRAFPEDGGDHTDVGPGFPWDVFMDMVSQRLEGEMELTDQGPLPKWAVDRWGPTEPSFADGRMAVQSALFSGYSHSRAMREELREVAAQQAQGAAQVASLTALVQQLVETITSGGGDIDMVALQQKLDESRAQMVSEVRAALAAAGRAQADSLGG